MTDTLTGSTIPVFNTQAYTPLGEFHLSFYGLDTEEAAQTAAALTYIFKLCTFTVDYCEERGFGAFANDKVLTEEVLDYADRAAHKVAYYSALAIAEGQTHKVPVNLTYRN